MKIFITKHCFDRYKERMKKIYKGRIVEKNGEEYVEVDYLEKEIIGGSCHLNKNEDNSYIIVCNNLTVYRAHNDNFSDIGKVLVIDTVYPYKKSLRGWINKEFEKVELF